ncbi:MAG: nitroreductase family protein [Promethearchaeota archaeon]
MDFYEVIKKRKSTRKFEDQLVPLDVVKRIIDAARLAPTWANKQGVRYVVVRERGRVKKVAAATGQKWTAGAPMFIVAISKKSWSGKGRNEHHYFLLDVGISFEHLILAATAEGLGTCWIGWFDGDAMKGILNIPGRLEVIALTPLGYPAGEVKATDRLDLSEIAFMDEYEKPLKD